MSPNNCFKLASCRVCKEKKLDMVLSVGPTPLANEFLTKQQIDLPEAFYPLDLYFCNNCTMVQLGHVVDPKILFGNYVYVSSTSPVFVNHFVSFAHDITTRFSLDSKSLVIDIGSNDGILLKPYQKMNIRTLGIEPAKHIAEIAKKDGIETVSEYFSVELAKDIVAKKGKAKVVTATNVFAHIHDLDEVISGLDILLDENGIFIMEAPYLVDFIEKKYFDLIYHEHLSYWAIKPLIVLFKRFNMEVFDVQKVAVHGGSIRVFVKKQSGNHQKTARLEEFLTLEKKFKLESKDTYIQYSNEVLINKMKLIDLLTDLKLKGKKIVGYGAPAKGNTLLNYFKVGVDYIDYIVDDSSFKQGLFTPGTRIPVVKSDTLKTETPDYILILAWNFAESIMKNYEWFKSQGGKFILPVPEPKIV